jgi:K+-sensing histidine kinase KdpD
MARPSGTPNRDKAELRALLQERVREFTELRRQQDIDAGMSPDEAQQVIEDYDPVVQMGMIAVDRREKREVQLRAASEVAQYVRPKLKSVEVTTDPEAMETLQERQQLSSRLLSLLEMAAEAKQASPPDSV